MPFPNEHAARVRNPGDFKKGSFRSKAITTGVRAIIGRLKSKVTTTAQAFRFNVSHFTAAQARKWLKDNNVKYISFEPASKSVASEDPKIKKFGDMVNEELKKQGGKKSIRDAVEAVREAESEEED